jgi:hypothetical protein
MKRIIDPVTYPIAPRRIDTSGHFWNAFGNHKTEISANWIVWFCQERSGWHPFTLAELEEFYHANGFAGGFEFNGLDTDGFVALRDGKYELTHEFVASCFKSSPAI